MTNIIYLLAFNSAVFGLPKGLLRSICYIESGYNVKAVHKDDGGGNSVGVCQIKLKTARWLGFKGAEKDLMNPEVNAYYAAKYLRHQLKRYHNNVQKSIIAYNQGSAKHLTRTNYSARVLKRWGSGANQSRR